MPVENQKVGKFVIITSGVFLVVGSPLVGARLSAGIIFLSWLLLYLIFPIIRNVRATMLFCVVFIIFELIPVDFDLFGIQGEITGTVRKGPRLVRVIRGKPKLTQCKNKYGEFILGGCTYPPYAPTWVLVLN